MDLIEYISALKILPAHTSSECHALKKLAEAFQLGKEPESTFSPLFVWVPPRIKAGIPAAEDRIQMHTLIILALIGVRKSRAFTGWHTAT